MNEEIQKLIDKYYLDKQVVNDAIDILLKKFKVETHKVVSSLELQSLGINTKCKITKTTYLSKENIIDFKKGLGL